MRDSDLSATNKLMQSVNGYVVLTVYICYCIIYIDKLINIIFIIRGSSPYEYQYIVSESLGRSTYKERYLFIYR